MENIKLYYKEVECLKGFFKNLSKIKNYDLIINTGLFSVNTFLKLSIF